VKGGGARAGAREVGWRGDRHEAECFGKRENPYVGPFDPIPFSLFIDPHLFPKRPCDLAGQQPPTSLRSNETWCVVGLMSSRNV